MSTGSEITRRCRGRGAEILYHEEMCYEYTIGPMSILTEKEMNITMIRISHVAKKHVRILEMAFNKSQFQTRVLNLAKQIAENWCLCQYCHKYSKDFFDVFSLEKRAGRMS